VTEITLVSDLGLGISLRNVIIVIMVSRMNTNPVVDEVLVLGLTGGIASGKSFVSDCFKSCGAEIVSADQLSREVVNPGTPTLEKLVDLFGSEILTSQGSLDREFVARKVFSSPTLRSQLEAVTHPAIAHLAECRLSALKKEAHDLIVYESPLLFEAGVEKRVDLVLVVIVTPEEQIRRLVQRDHLSEAEARQRIRAHWPQQDKVQKADFVIDNSGAMAQTKAHVKQLYDYLTR
jgi:dephospho-CoA kinase